MRRLRRSESSSSLTSRVTAAAKRIAVWSSTWRPESPSSLERSACFDPRSSTSRPALRAHFPATCPRKPVPPRTTTRRITLLLRLDPDREEIVRHRIEARVKHLVVHREDEDRVEELLHQNAK